MSEEFEYSFKKLQEAFGRLIEGVQNSKDELDKDGVIQRFEFTYELLWKTLKIYFENEGIICETPKSCFKEAFRVNIIENEAVILKMLEDRNKTSHIYSKEISDKIFKRVKTDYIDNIQKIIDKLKLG